MGIHNFYTKVTKHAGLGNNILTKPQQINAVYVDMNALVHGSMEKTIRELDQILLFTHLAIHSSEFNEYLIRKLSLTNDLGNTESYIHSELADSSTQVEQLVAYYAKYSIGTTYESIKATLTDNVIEDIIVAEIIDYLYTILGNMNDDPSQLKYVYVALDGVPSAAKMNEQRQRRFVNSYINNIKNALKLKYKYSSVSIDLYKFKNCIVPGTDFMVKLATSLRAMALDGVTIEISDSHDRGEGEKKIIHKAVKIICSESYDVHCIISPDSDVIILSSVLYLMCMKKYPSKSIWTMKLKDVLTHDMEFIDIIQFISNIKSQYVCDDTFALELLFVLFIFGNDFIPELKPLSLKYHLDFVLDVFTCTYADYGLPNKLFHIQNGVPCAMNYHFLYTFLQRLNHHAVLLATEKAYNKTYYNYGIWKKQLSVSTPELRVSIDGANFESHRSSLFVTFKSVKDFINEHTLNRTITSQYSAELYDRLASKDDDHRYCLLVLPFITNLRKLTDDDLSKDPKIFFDQLCQHFSNVCDKLKVSIFLMYKKYDLTKSTGSGYSDDMMSLNQSLNPYRSMFGLKQIDARMYGKPREYYGEYLHIRNSLDVIAVVDEFMCGIEWLFQYYILNRHLECSGWKYTHNHSPLMADVISRMIGINSANKSHRALNDHLQALLKTIPDHDFSPKDNENYVTPNDYTNAGVTHHVADIANKLDGNDCDFINKCKVDWGLFAHQ
jgi:5'-3' exonuclease